MRGLRSGQPHTVRRERSGRFPSARRGQLKGSEWAVDSPGHKSAEASNSEGAGSLSTSASTTPIQRSRPRVPSSMRTTTWSSFAVACKRATANIARSCSAMRVLRPKKQARRHRAARSRRLPRHGRTTRVPGQPGQAESCSASPAPGVRQLLQHGLEDGLAVSHGHFEVNGFAVFFAELGARRP